MSARVKQYLPELRRLARMSKKQRNKYVATCPKDLVLCICEIVRNVIKGHIPVKACHLKKLSPHKRLLRKLALKNTSLTQRKKILQKGGLAAWILNPILSTLTSLVTNLASNAVR
jgi:hypothetical protein